MLNNAEKIELYRNEAVMGLEKVKLIAVLASFYCCNAMDTANSQLNMHDINYVFRIIEEETKDITSNLDCLEILLNKETLK